MILIQVGTGLLKIQCALITIITIVVTIVHHQYQHKHHQ